MQQIEFQATKTRNTNTMFVYGISIFRMDDEGCTLKLSTTTPNLAKALTALARTVAFSKMTRL
jgi:hypothetical protein